MEPTAQPAPAATVTTAPSLPPTGYVSNPFVLIWNGLRLLGVNLGTLFGLIGLFIAVVIAFVPALIVALMAHGNSSLNAVALILGAAAVVVAILFGVRLLAGSYLLYLMNARGEKVGTMELVRRVDLNLSFRLVGLSIVMGLAILGGLLLLVVPGVIFAYWWSLAPYILIDQNCGISEAMKRSHQLVRGHAWEMFGIYGATQIFGLLQYIPVLGAIVGAVLGLASGTGTALRYSQLGQLGDTKPVVSPWNYVAVLLGPIILIIIMIVAFSTGNHSSNV